MRTTLRVALAGAYWPSRPAANTERINTGNAQQFA